MKYSGNVTNTQFRINALTIKCIYSNDLSNQIKQIQRPISFTATTALATLRGACPPDRQGLKSPMMSWLV